MILQRVISTNVVFKINRYDQLKQIMVF